MRASTCCFFLLTQRARGKEGNERTYWLAGLAECFHLREALLDITKISLLPEQLLGSLH